MAFVAPAASAAPPHRPESAPAGTPTTIRAFLAFKRGPEEHGIDSLRAQEIGCCDEPARIADAPAHGLGVVNLGDRELMACPEMGRVEPPQRQAASFQSPGARRTRTH